MDELNLQNESPYIQRLKREVEYSKENIAKARKRISEKKLNAEEIYGKIGESLKKSPITESSHSTFNTSIPRASSSPSPEYTEILEVIPVDPERTVEIRTNPNSPNNFEYAATKQVEVHPKRASWDTDLNSPPPVPRIEKKDIAKLNLDKSGHVSMVKSSLRGTGEQAVERLLMEATKRDMPPHSRNLLAPGKKMVAKFKKMYDEMPKEKYLQKIGDFLNTGKTGKIWSTVAPYMGPIGTAATILGGLSYADLAGAVTDTVIPGGVEELGVSPEQAELDRRYADKVRKLSNKRK